MAVKLKPLSEQTIVITGASSGIGLTTARMAAKAGAKVVLVARSEDALKQLADEINAADGRAIYIVADVGDPDEVQRVSELALETFGGFDTWVNDAGVGIWGKVTETSLADMHRLFDTNFWGVVYGSLEAVKVLRQRGGALINVGSAVSDRVVHMQGVYSSSKHAVKGFTDAIRMELEADDAPVSVTLIKPGAINTPFPEHARNYMSEEPGLPPPVYAPETVAKAILHCAQVPTRDLFVGSGGKSLSSLGYHAPRLGDKLMESDAFVAMNKSKEPRQRPFSDSGLEHPANRLSERGNYKGHTKEVSLYTQAKTNPWIAGAVVAGAGLVAAALWWEGQNKGSESPVGGFQPLMGINPSSIREHMEVLGSDGTHVGVVDHVENGYIKLTRNDFEAGGQHHLLSVSRVATVDQSVRLSITGAEAMRQWQAV